MHSSNPLRGKAEGHGCKNHYSEAE